MKTLKFDVRLNTSGKGYWSEAKKAVRCTAAKIAYMTRDLGFGELRVTYDRRTWKDEDGLVYTDPLWLKEFRQVLITFGFSKRAANDVSYSEQGMQGEDYISLDVGKFFLKAASKINF